MSSIHTHPKEGVRWNMELIPITPLETELLNLLGPSSKAVSLSSLFGGRVPAWVESPMAALRLRSLVEVLAAGTCRLTPAGRKALSSVTPSRAI